MRCFRDHSIRIACLTLLASCGATTGVRGELPRPGIVSLLQGETKEWRLPASKTAKLVIAEGYASEVWKSESGDLMGAIGRLPRGGARLIVFADPTFLSGDAITGEGREAILNSLRWGGKGRSPRVGLAPSLASLGDSIQSAGMTPTVLTLEELDSQVDLYCIVNPDEKSVSENAQARLRQFLASGGGLVLAGSGTESQMEFFNSLISPAGIRFTAPANGTVADEILVTAAPIAGSQTNPTSVQTGKSGSMGEGPKTLSEPILVREPIQLPPSSDGPIGAALELINSPSKRNDPALIAQLREGTDLSGDKLVIFQEALHQLNLAIGPIIPTAEEPIIPGADPLVDAVMEIETNFNNTLPVDQIRKIPGADGYPGEVPEDAPRVAASVTIDVNYKGWLLRNGGGGARANEWRCTGLYAPPGEAIRVTVPANLADKGLLVRIGAYGGILDDEWEEWKRYRNIARSFPIESKETLAANGFGGIITIEVPIELKGEESDWREILIEGGVEAPLYEHGKTSLEAWEEIRKRPAPWTELASDRIILTVPSNQIRDLRNPDEVMDLWDRIVEGSAELASLDRDQYRIERIVFDQQMPNPGTALHAGQPIAARVGRPVETAVTPEYMHTFRVWGYLHELGHVYQDSAWTLPGSIEASCDLWSVYLSEEILDLPREEAHFTLKPLDRRNRIQTYFRNGANFESDWHGTTARESYLQIQEAFGWDPFKKLFASYHDFGDPRRWSGQQEKNDEWVIRLSELCGVNLTPFYRTWGLPVSDEAAEKTARLPEWEEDPVKEFRK